MDLTWFGWVYVAFLALSVIASIVCAGERRSPWPTGWGLLLSLSMAAFLAYGVFVVGATR